MGAGMADVECGSFHQSGMNSACSISSGSMAMAERCAAHEAVIEP
jgi:hypothetical protein